MKKILKYTLGLSLCLLFAVGCGDKNKNKNFLKPAILDYTMDYRGEEKTIAVESNLTWTAVSGAGWLTVSYTENSITFKANAATDGGRSTTITCTSSDPAVSAVITVAQNEVPKTYIDSTALVALYNATAGSSWTQTWNLSQPVSQWYGVTITDGRVTKLDLSGNNLEGTIPVEFYGLNGVKELNLSNNVLSGTIEVQIGQLIAIEYLDLNNNQITGDLPEAISSLTNLYYLDLSRNKMQRAIPGLIGSLRNLVVLDLSYNNFASLPVNLRQLEALEYMAVRNNKLTGAIPAEIKYLTKLKVLDLSSNIFTGTIPDLSTLTKLQVLFLYSNALADNIPAYMSNFPALQELALDANNLTGSIPAGLGNLPKLKQLWLEENRLIGRVPSSLTQHALWPQWRANVINQKDGVVLDDGSSPAPVMKTMALRERPSKESYKK